MVSKAKKNAAADTPEPVAPEAVVQIRNPVNGDVREENPTVADLLCRKQGYVVVTGDAKPAGE